MRSRKSSNLLSVVLLVIGLLVVGIGPIVSFSALGATPVTLDSNTAYKVDDQKAAAFVVLNQTFRGNVQSLIGDKDTAFVTQKEVAPLVKNTEYASIDWSINRIFKLEGVNNNFKDRPGWTVIATR